MPYGISIEFRNPITACVAFSVQEATPDHRTFPEIAAALRYELGSPETPRQAPAFIKAANHLLKALDNQDPDAAKHADSIVNQAEGLLLVSADAPPVYGRNSIIAIRALARATLSNSVGNDSSAASQARRVALHAADVVRPPDRDDAKDDFEVPASRRPDRSPVHGDSAVKRYLNKRATAREMRNLADIQKISMQGATLAIEMHRFQFPDQRVIGKLNSMISKVASLPARNNWKNSDEGKALAKAANDLQRMYIPRNPDGCSPFYFVHDPDDAPGWAIQMQNDAAGLAKKIHKLCS